MCRPQIAHAAGRSGWEPRRHFRRLARSEANSKDVDKAAPVPSSTQSFSMEPQQPGDLQAQFAAFRSSVEGAVRPLIDTARGNTRATRSQTQAQPATQSIGQHQWTSSAPPPAPPRPLPFSSPVSASAAGSVAVVAGVLVLAWVLLQKVWDALRGAGRRNEGGRWVADRALGGKEVFVPDDTSLGSQYTGGTMKQHRRDTRMPDRSRPSLAPSGTRVLTAGTRRGSLSVEPEWWLEPRPPMYVHPNQKEQGTQAARRLLRDLQNAKSEGRAYPVSALVELRETCQAANTSVQPNTDAGRDSIFRAAVAAALSEAVNSQSGRLAGLKPQQFVAGISKDLSVPLGRAVQIVHAEVASRVRTMIIDACAARRAGNTPDEMQQMLRLSALLAQFPLPRESAEGEIIASSISARTTLDERQSIFLAFGAMAPLNAPLMAELLGFNPSQVLPQLEEYTRGR